MKKNRFYPLFFVVLLLVGAALVLLGRALRRHTPQLIQGRVECTTYRASSKVAGRIVELRVEEGDRVEQGELLYTLAIPELDAKLQQVEALRTAAGALDAATVAGARKPQIRAAQSLWQKAQAGLELARKSYERVRRLHESGVVPAQQLDEARANYEAMRATERRMPIISICPGCWTTSMRSSNSVERRLKRPAPRNTMRPSPSSASVKPCARKALTIRSRSRRMSPATRLRMKPNSG